MRANITLYVTKVNIIYKRT